MTVCVNDNEFFPDFVEHIPIHSETKRTNWIELSFTKTSGTC